MLGIGIANVADIESEPFAGFDEPARGDDGADVAPSPFALLLLLRDDVISSVTALERRLPAGEGGGKAGARPVGFAMLMTAERDIADGDDVADDELCCISRPLDIDRDSNGGPCCCCDVLDIVSTLGLDVANERDDIL